MSNTSQDTIASLRKAHHEAIEQLYEQTTGKKAPEGIGLWRKLRRIERMASHYSTCYCNGEVDSDFMERKDDEIRIAVARVFDNHSPAGLYYNKDPRGYALKLDREQGAIIPVGMHKDWGGYGILAPEID